MILTKDDHVQRIIKWRESLEKMSDNHFFELVRMYLGEVKTPYNKQKLIEELGNFFRKDDNRKMLVHLLSDSDICVITAIVTIPFATQQKLTSFFQGRMSFAALYERLLNLEERLIIFRVLDPDISDMVFAINPLLESILLPLTNISFILPQANIDPVRNDMESHFHLSPQFLAAFVAFVAVNPQMCKADGSLKKRIDSILLQAFPQYHEKDIFHRLILAFKNLSIFSLDDSGISINYAKLKIFSEQEQLVQYAYICAAVDNTSRRDYCRFAKLLLDMIAGIPSSGFTLSVLIRSAFLIGTNNDFSSVEKSSLSASRFSQIINKTVSSENKKNDDSYDKVRVLIENATLFGMLTSLSVPEYDEPVCFSNASEIIQDIFLDAKLLSVDAGFSITILPGFPLSTLIQIEQYMELAYFDTITSLEITRQSCFRAFDLGLSDEQLIESLKKCAIHDIPQNLIFSIKDWYIAFNSVSLYFGYVLCVDEDKLVLIKNNKILSPHIKKILSPTVLLLDFLSSQEAISTIEKSGLDFIGSIKTAESQHPISAFPVLNQSKNPFPVIPNTQDTKNIVFERLNEDERAKLFSELRQSLNSLSLPQDQADGLLSRINRKIILNVTQLRGDSVKLEKLEASGMDYLGKIHLINHAISTGSMVEISAEDDSVILGSPIRIEKVDSEEVAVISVSQTQIEEKFFIGKIRHVRRIRGSIFKEL